MQEHFNTFRPELQGVKNIKTVKNSVSYDVYCVRIDKRPHCCGVKPHVKDYRTVNITLPAHNRKKVTAHVKKQRYVYYIVKEFHRIIDMKKPLSFERRLNGLIDRLSKLETKQSKKLKLTLQSWKQEIVNIIKHGISNGFVEGNNNKIKVIKRISYGLRNYDNFRKLIFLRLY